MKITNQRTFKSHHFYDIKTENDFHWISHSIIMCCICKSRKIMLSNEIICSFSHDCIIKFISTMVSVATVKRIQEGVIIYLVVINLAYGGKPSMKVRHGRTNLPNSYIRRKKTIESSMNVFQAMVVKWRNKVCHLKPQLVGTGSKQKHWFPNFHRRHISDQTWPQAWTPLSVLLAPTKWRSFLSSFVARVRAFSTRHWIVGGDSWYCHPKIVF